MDLKLDSVAKILEAKINYLKKHRELGLQCSSIEAVKKEIEDLFVDVPEHNGHKSIGNCTYAFTGLLTFRYDPIIVLTAWEPTTPFIDPNQQKEEQVSKKYARNFWPVRDNLNVFSYMHQLLFSGIRLNIVSRYKFATRINNLIAAISEMEESPDKYLVKQLVHSEKHHEEIKNIISSFYGLFKTYYNDTKFHFLTENQLKYIDFNHDKEDLMYDFLKGIRWDTNPIIVFSHQSYDLDISFVTNAIRSLQNTEDKLILKLIKRLQLNVDEETLKTWEEALSPSVLQTKFDAFRAYCKSKRIPITLRYNNYTCPMCLSTSSPKDDWFLLTAKNETLETSSINCHNCNQPLEIFVTINNLEQIKTKAQCIEQRRFKKESHKNENNQNNEILVIG